MATEPDQTKWVGIRPTPDCNDIPTTTRKLAPAISDLQAIEDVIANYAAFTLVNCTANAYKQLDIVLAGELFVITTVAASNLTSLCDIELLAFIDGRVRPLKAIYSVEPELYQTWNGFCVLKEGDHIIFNFLKGGVSDTLVIWYNGYKIGVY